MAMLFGIVIADVQDKYGLKNEKCTGKFCNESLPIFLPTNTTEYRTNPSKPAYTVKSASQPTSIPSVQGSFETTPQTMLSAELSEAKNGRNNFFIRLLISHRPFHQCSQEIYRRLS